jgi:hypothetical protein
MTDELFTCISCNENAVTLTELYCFHCYVEKEVEAMIEYDILDQLFLTKEAN